MIATLNWVTARKSLGTTDLPKEWLHLKNGFAVKLKTEATSLSGQYH